MANPLIKVACFVRKGIMFSISKEAYLNLLVQGGQMYRAFPFSKGSLPPPTSKTYKGTAHFFKLSFIIEGTAEKVLQFIMPLKSNNNRNVCFNEKNVFLDIVER
jgi:hypothetical protein